MNWFDKIIEKLNPAQGEIYQDYGENQSTTSPMYTISKAYYNIEVVNRGVNLIVDSAATIDFDIKNKMRDFGVYTPEPGSTFNKIKLEKLLNFKPNPYQNVDAFRRNVYTDYILEGNAFIYFDGIYLYHLPAAKVEIITDKKTYVKGYKYNDTVSFNYDEVLHIKENSAATIYRGDSRLLSALPAIQILKSMQGYQDNFFKNNAIPGLVLTTPNTLSQKVKDRILLNWSRQYNPTTGGKRPAILDGDFDLKNLGHTDFRELDFKDSIEVQEKKVLKALGVPPILLDSGNNANITPNLRMFYINTILPIVDRITKEVEFFFGYDVDINKADILALRPELKEEEAYHVGLVNAGILTVNESRDKLRYPKSDEEHASMLRIPANIAGSAVNPTEGGRPSDDGKN